jgi:hypothetical protein
MSQETLELYATLQLQMRALEDRISELKPTVLQYCLEHQDEDLMVDSGQLSLQIRRTWKYPKDIEVLEEQLHEEKKAAEAKGEATYTEKPIVVFKEFKEKKLTNE